MFYLYHVSYAEPESQRQNFINLRSIRLQLNSYLVLLLIKTAIALLNLHKTTMDICPELRSYLIIAPYGRSLLSLRLPSWQPTFANKSISSHLCPENLLICQKKRLPARQTKE